MEKIVVKLGVDGVELEPLDMGKGETDSFYEEDMVFYKGGYIFNKEHTHGVYSCSIRLSRHKTKEEKSAEREAQK
jgi:hypothetical protein